MANFQSLGLRADEIKPIAKREHAHDTVDCVGGKDAHFTKMFVECPPRSVQIAWRL